MTGGQSLPRRGLAVFQTEPAPRVLGLVRAAEDAGYSHLWLGDSQNIWREAATTLGAAAACTSRVVLGTGVTNPVTRHPSVLASMWATLAELSSGRVALGIGTGYTSLGTLGRKSVPLAALESTVADLRSLMRGEPVTDEDSGTSYRLAYLPEGGYRVPVYVAASGPKALRLAGSVADGVIMMVGAAGEFVAQALAHVAAGAAETGRTLSDVDVVLWVHAAICDDPQIARDRVRGRVVRMVNRRIPMTMSPALTTAVERVRANTSDRTADYYHHQASTDADAQQVPDELVDAFALAGTPDQCTARLREYTELGVQQVAIVPFGEAWTDRLRTIRTFAALGTTPDPT